jgi:hypothetical protein
MSETTYLLSVEETIDTMIDRINRLRSSLYTSRLTAEERRQLKERIDRWRLRLAVKLAEEN